MNHSLPYVPLSNKCPAPGPEESVIPVTFQGRPVAEATFDGVCYNFDLEDKASNAIISGTLVYIPRYVDVDSDGTPSGKRRRYTEIELLRSPSLQQPPLR